MNEDFRYKAFISYAHADKRWASRLHRWLESYRVPRALASRSESRRPLRPIFRDREELAAGSTLGAALEKALVESEYLLVVCSPASARSKWVNEEIRSYRALRGLSNILALIVAGEPGSGGNNECLPPALIEPNRSGDPLVEPICADARRSADGNRLARLKIAAAMLGVGLDELVRRENARRQRSLAAIATASTAGTVAMGGLALYANEQRLEAVEQTEIARQNEEQAEATVNFLIDTFEVADPATENARTISAFTVLERGANRIATELAGQPKVQVRLNSAMGQIYLNLGLHAQAEKLFQANETLVDTASRNAVSNRLNLARTAYTQGDLMQGLTILGEADRLAKKYVPRDGELFGSIHHLRGLIFRAQVRLEPALAEYRKAARLFSDAGNRHLQLGALSMAGGTETLLGRNEEAEATLRRALAMSLELNGPSHRETGFAYNALAFNALEGGRPDAAAHWGSRCIAVWQKVLGDDHPLLATALMLQGRAYSELERPLDAGQAFERAGDILSRAYPGGHYEIGFAKVYLALVRSEEGETREALKLLNEAGQQYDLSYGGMHANHGDLEAHRAIVLHEANREEEAAAACARADEILRQTVGPGSATMESVMSLCRERPLHR